jgi:hypothetical protein
MTPADLCWWMVVPAVSFGFGFVAGRLRRDQARVKPPPAPRPHQAPDEWGFYLGSLGGDASAA